MSFYRPGIGFASANTPMGRVVTPKGLNRMAKLPNPPKPKTVKRKAAKKSTSRRATR